MAVGAASGLVAGLLLMGDSGNIVHVDGPSITVYTDGADYRKGDPVTALVVNSGSVPLASDDSWGLRVNGLSGMLIYDAPASGDASLEPGARVAVTWNQTKGGGSPALEGLYRLTVEGYDPDGGLVQGSTTFSIWK